MSFLLKRNKPKSRAYWLDEFERQEDPIAVPWRHLGDGWSKMVNGELVISGNGLSTNGGGVSYGREPLTPTWGLEIDYYWAPSGTSQRTFLFGITNMFADIGAKFEKVIGVILGYSPVYGHQISVVAIPSFWGQTSNIVIINKKAPSFGGNMTLKLLIDKDSYGRLYHNGTFIGAFIIPDGYLLAPRRRSLRIFNGGYEEAYLRYMLMNDRDSTCTIGAPFPSSFVDNFNRANGAPGNGWTRMGPAAQSQITSNAYSPAGTTDGAKAIIRNTGVTWGTLKLRGVIGGGAKIDDKAYSALLIRANSTATQGYMVTIDDNKIQLVRLTGSIAANMPSIEVIDSVSMTVAQGSEVSICCADRWIWVEFNGTVKLVTYEDSIVVPTTNSWAGPVVSRKDLGNSNSWDEVGIHWRLA